VEMERAAAACSSLPEFMHDVSESSSTR
jgi:hypothetical protein